MIQRYKIISTAPGYEQFRPMKHPDGGWVTHADHKKRVERLEAALREVTECFYAAAFEGLAERLEEGNADTGTLIDLVRRRLLPANEAAQTALTNDAGEGALNLKGDATP